MAAVGLVCEMGYSLLEVFVHVYALEVFQVDALGFHLRLFFVARMICPFRGGTHFVQSLCFEHIMLVALDSF
jgi:hypothetical protein